MSKRDTMSHLRVVDLRLVKDRRDRWRLYVEGVEVDLHVALGPFGSGPVVTLAKFLAERVTHVSIPFPVRLWSAIWFRKPWGHP